MSKPFLIATAASIFIVSCEPPPPVPPPRFRPNPPYAPQPVGPDGEPQNPYGQNSTLPPSPLPPSPLSEPATRPGEYPTAQRTANPNQVISPYEPYDVVDVEGFSSGQLVRDPVNKKIFRVP
ncbi:MAG: hypothetical protein H8M99_08060 [Gloeobacteraceae cyanobacterium ES-bin-144]|nr:hypothetical protein [Verrucomicrobiales bacterium]